MIDRVWQVPDGQFVAVRNRAASLAEAAERIKQLAGGPAPGWAVRARALAMRKAGVKLKQLKAA